MFENYVVKKSGIILTNDMVISQILETFLSSPTLDTPLPFYPCLFHRVNIFG
jgi:hypothetical protein